MGLRRLSAELKKARGTLSQKAAAARWQVPYSTLCALEQQQQRNYQPHTLAHFDEMLGRSAWDLYDQPDEAGWDVPAASLSSVEELQAKVAEHARQLAELTELAQAIAQHERGSLEALLDELDADELATVEAFVHFVLSRRRSAG